MTRWLKRAAMEPPIRLLTRTVLQRVAQSPQTRTTWDLSERPAYLLGVLTAAERARDQGVPEICVIEFGVAGGRGLLALEREAAAVERSTGVRIQVFGFDAGSGLPSFSGDYRDHPDYWQAGDFPMDEAALRKRLSSRTSLILGNVRETVPHFVEHVQSAPVGFVSFDLDLYSSTKDAMQVLSHPGKRMLRQTPLYFDDLQSFINHRFAGELLAIDEFNDSNRSVKIDRWRGLRVNRPFPESPYLERMYVAHDLEAISATVLTRSTRILPPS
jgi:hypothetical protein